MANTLDNEARQRLLKAARLLLEAEDAWHDACRANECAGMALREVQQIVIVLRKRAA